MENYSKLYEEFENWISKTALGLSTETVKQYLFVTKGLLNFLMSFKVFSLNEVNHHTFKKFIHVKPNSEPYSNASIRQRIAVLDLFFAWAIENSLMNLNNNPVIYYKRMKVLPKRLDEKKDAETTPVEILSVKDQEILIKLGGRDDFLSIRNYCITLLIMTMGLYAEEIVTLNFDAVNLEKDYIVIGKGKLNEREVKILTKECKKACRDWQSIREKYLAGSQQLTYFFNHRLSPLSTKSLYEIISKYLSNSGIQKKHMGSELLRQTAICNMIRDGYSVDEIKNITGIKTASQIEKYKEFAQ